MTEMQMFACITLALILFFIGISIGYGLGADDLDRLRKKDESK